MPVFGKDHAQTKKLEAMTTAPASSYETSEWLTPAVRALPPAGDPQTAGDLAAANITGLRLLHMNESPYPPSPRAVEAAMTTVQNDLHRYPAARGQPLADAIAKRIGVKPNQIVIGDGSGELILFTVAIAMIAGGNAVGPAPTFPNYANATRVFGGSVVRTRLDAQGAPDARALLAAMNDKTRIVYCCTPNPPSGGMMSADAIRLLAEGVPDNVFLVIDEAYVEFAMFDGGPDLLPILSKRAGPWVSLRTFSKAYSLAGLRVGYAICGSDEVFQAYRRSMVAFNVSNVGLNAAYAALHDDEHLQRTLTAVVKERRRLSDGMATLGLKPMPSHANFVSALWPQTAGAAIAELRRRGIMARDWRDPDHMREIRITVGTPADTDAVLQALTEMLEEHRVTQAGAAS
jgi:histidinol-phosphate aminotransferase